MPLCLSLPALTDWHCVLAHPSHPDRSLSVFLDGMDWHRPTAEPRIFLSTLFWQSFRLCWEDLTCFLLQLTPSLGIKNISNGADTGNNSRVFFPAPVKGEL